MLEVKVTLNGRTEIASMKILQKGDGESGGSHRNYDVAARWAEMRGGALRASRGHVNDHDREQDVWELIRKAIEGLGL